MTPSLNRPFTTGPTDAWLPKGPLRSLCSLSHLNDPGCHGRVRINTVPLVGVHQCSVYSKAQPWFPNSFQTSTLTAADLAERR